MAKSPVTAPSPLLSDTVHSLYSSALPPLLMAVPLCMAVHSHPSSWLCMPAWLCTPTPPRSSLLAPLMLRVHAYAKGLPVLPFLLMFPPLHGYYDLPPSCLPSFPKTFLYTHASCRCHTLCPIPNGTWAQTVIWIIKIVSSSSGCAMGALAQDVPWGYGTELPPRAWSSLCALHDQALWHIHHSIFLLQVPAQKHTPCPACPPCPLCPQGAARAGPRAHHSHRAHPAALCADASTFLSTRHSTYPTQ